MGDAPRPPDRHLLAHRLRRRLAEPRVAVAAALLRHLRRRRPAAAHPRLGRGRDRCMGDRLGRDPRPRQAQVPDDGIRARHGDDDVEPACPGAVAAARRLDRGPAAAAPLRLAAAPLLGVGEPARRSPARRAAPRRVALCGAARGHHASPAARRYCRALSRRDGADAARLAFLARHAAVARAHPPARDRRVGAALDCEPGAAPLLDHPRRVGGARCRARPCAAERSGSQEGRARHRCARARWRSCRSH